jgi:hypothetical protein
VSLRGDDGDRDDHPVREGGMSFSVAMVAIVAAIGGGLFGYDTGVISGAILYIKREFPIDVATEGLIVSAVTAGALAAAMCAGVLYVQPDVQGIINPGAAHQFGDALVLALQFGVPF